MKTIRVKFKSVNEVRTFVNATSECSDDVLVKSGRCWIDGKSIMGIFGLDLTHVLEVFVSDSDYNLLKPFELTDEE